MSIEMMMIGGQMNAVDTATGEIVNTQIDCLPDAFDIPSCVQTALFGDEVTKPVISTSEIKTETRGRKAKVTGNPYASLFANASYDEDTGACSLGKRMDDLLYSVATTTEKSTRIPVNQLIFVMKSAELSTKGIMETINKRRALKKSDTVGERYARILRTAADILIRRLGEPENADAIQLDAGMAFSFELDSVAYKRSEGSSNAVVCPIEFTEGDKETLRRLAVAGLDAQFETHIQKVTEQSGRMLQRIESKAVPFEKVYEVVTAEFPYESVQVEAEQPDEYSKWIDAINDKKSVADASDEPDWWISPMQVSVYTDEDNEPW